MDAKHDPTAIENEFLVRLQQRGEPISVALTPIELLLLERFRFSISLGYSLGRWEVREGKVFRVGVEELTSPKLLKKLQE